MEKKKIELEVAIDLLIQFVDTLDGEQIAELFEQCFGQCTNVEYNEETGELEYDES